MPFTQEFVNFETYWRGNRHYESAFSGKAFTGMGKHVNGLSDIFKTCDIQLVLLDSYGVLNNMEAVIPSAVAAFSWLREQGTPVHLVSNDARFHSHTRVAHYHAWGFNFSANEMVNSFDTLMHHVEQEQAELWGAVNLPHEHKTHKAWQGRVEDLSNGADIESASHLSLLCTTPVQDAVRENVKNTLQKTDKKLWVGNPDVGVIVEEDTYFVTPGGIAQSLTPEEGMICDKLKLLGKPWPEIFLMASRKYPDIAPENILMVGDTLHTDILGGNNLGFKTLLVESGVYQSKNTDALIVESGITPDFISAALKV